MPPDFDQITLTDEEKETALYNARCTKYFHVKDLQKELHKNEVIRIAKKPFTAKELGDYVLQNKDSDSIDLPDFVVDEQAKPVFDLLCQYFTNDPEFEKDGRSLKKGIALLGPIGAGKSDMMKLFSINKRRCFYFESINEVVRLCQEKGLEYYETFSHYCPVIPYQTKYFFQQQIGWTLDDVGQEEMVNDYGNRAHAFSKIIQARYLRKEQIPFDTMHITSMYNAEELGNKYGGYVKSRLREMFNLIHYNGSDRRK